MNNFDGFEWNKIAGAVLGAALFVFGLNITSDFLFEVEKPERQGFAIAVAAENEGASSAQVEATKPIAERLVSASAEKGQAIAKACVACHVLDKSNTNKTGPGLWEIVGRKKGSHPGYPYSASLSAKAGETWTYEDLDLFLKSPKDYIKGTKMSFAGVKKDDQRAEVIAYLRTLSDSPQPLPAKK